MPTEKSFGSPSAANNAIDGVPVIHYFDWFSRGRGQAIRLLWEDAGIAYKDVRYTFEEYPGAKKTNIQQKNPTGNIPVVELNGKILTQSYAILRKMARLLGKYDGETEDEKYWADVICDIVIDWRTLFVAAYNGPNYAEHEKTTQRHYLKAIEEQLQSNELSQQGPYTIGKKITYADFVLYQVLHDEDLTKNGRKKMQEFPRLIQLVDAMEARPNIKAFLQSDTWDNVIVTT